MTLIPPMIDALGWIAAALTLLAFSCNSVLRLRYSALAANAAFIAYGVAAQLWPVLALHLVLVPVNGWRLLQARKREFGPGFRARPAKGLLTGGSIGVRSSSWPRWPARRYWPTSRVG